MAEIIDQLKADIIALVKGQRELIGQAKLLAAMIEGVRK